LKNIRINNDYVLYFHLNRDTKKVFYVGIGSLKRASLCYESVRNKFWVNYVKKYGEPIVKIVKKDISFDEAALLEKYYIKKYGRKCIDPKGILVNISEGGEKTAKGFKHTIEARKKISEAGKNRVVTDENRNKTSLRFKGYKHSEEAKLKNSLAKRGANHPNFGKHRSDETKRKIGEANKGKLTWSAKKVINTNTKEIYPSSLYVAKIFFPNMNPTSLSYILNGKNSNNTCFQYLDDFNNGKEKYVNNYDGNKPKKIIHNKTGDVYNSIAEAGRLNGISDGAVHFHLKGKLKKSEPVFSYYVD